ncbi:MAG: hypothetical protein RL040_556 [Bacteroidota bacterium]|jgi:hypothetical protein
MHHSKRVLIGAQWLFSRVITCVGFLLLFSCGDSPNPQPTIEGVVKDGISTSGTIMLQGHVVMIPPPAILSHSIAMEKISFERQSVSEPDRTSQLTSEMKRALNLGVLGADLSYLINHNQTGAIPQYLAAIRQLTDNLGISQEVDPEILKQIEAGLDDPANMLGLQGVFFRNLESYLKKNNRNAISIYILLGGWIEALHQLASPADSTAGHPLDRFLAEQTYSAQGVRSLMDSLQNESFAPIRESMIDICDALDDLEKEYEFKSPIHDRREKVTYVRSKASVICSESELLELHGLIRETRQLILAP